VRTTIIVTVGLMCLLIAVVLFCSRYPSRTFNDHVRTIYIGAIDGECTVHLGIPGPQKRMPCPMVAKYLRDDAELPVGTTVGVGLFDEKSRYDYLISDLRSTGYKSTIIGIRRVTLTN
jgi:hypothetical protein